MHARDLFIGSFQMMQVYWRTFLMIAIPIFMIQIAFGMATNYAMIQNVSAALENPLDYNPASYWMSGCLIFSFALSIFMLLVAAVAWHRRALLDEMFSYRLHSFFNKNIGAYFVGSLILFCLYLGISIVAVVVFALLFGVAAIGNGNAFTWFVFIITFLLTVAFCLWLLQFLMRASVILPARAVGKPIGIRQAIHDTTNQGWMLIRFYLILLTVSIVLYLPFVQNIINQQNAIQNSFDMGALDSQAILASISTPPLDIVYSAFLATLYTIFYIGVFTILYAQFVRNDP